MKRQLLLTLTLSVLAANVFAAGNVQQPVAQHSASVIVAQDGSDRTLNRVAQDGSDRTLNRVSLNASDRTSVLVAQDGSDRTLNRAS
ncbi:hypothetical protein [Pseudomonas sp.]|uniref:hypothetical protein n=1 Tax=Pseudomonas sp. TaxID=306 RepID=UPI003CC61D92